MLFFQFYMKVRADRMAVVLENRRLQYPHAVSVYERAHATKKQDPYGSRIYWYQYVGGVECREPLVCAPIELAPVDV
jgi:hypothetical protein